MSIEDKIKEQIKDNAILIYMKGSPYEPKCGFSAKTVQVLIDCGAEFSYVDILENQDIDKHFQLFQNGQHSLNYLSKENLLEAVILLLRCTRQVSCNQ